MLTFEPNVVVIDDKPDEVKGIIDYYRKLGIGCRYFNTDRISDDIYPDSPFSDVSIVFLDLYFSEGLDSFDAEICVDWIGSIIPEKAFYILVIWTKEIEHQQEIIELLKSRNLLPFKYIVHNKIDFISPNQEKEKYNFDNLMKEINTALDHTPALSEIGIWKRNVKSASNQVIGGLTKVPDPEKVNMKLQKLIVSHGGTSIVDEFELRKREILFDALNQVLASNASNIKNLPEIDKICGELLYNLPKKIKTDVDKELNSWFHFKLNEPSNAMIVPGLVSIMNNKLIKKLYSISDDEKLSKKLVNQNPQNGVNVEDIVVVISRPCDIAQKKSGKNIKLLSGLKIVNPYRYTEDNIGKKDKVKYLGRIDFIDLDLPDSCKLYDHLYFSDKESDVALLFDFRYVFSVPEKIFTDKFKNIKIFNKELLSEIQVEYSGYSSRLGITQII